MARALVALKLSDRIKNIIAFAQNIATAMTDNPTFPAPTPPMAQFSADIAALNTAEAAVLSRTHGAVETRNAKLEIVKGDLDNLKIYVQNVAAAAPPASADEIIASAGMTARTVTLHDKAALEAKHGDVSGTVVLTAKAAARVAAYIWEYSTDQKTWVSPPMTLETKTGVSGLTAGTVYSFRVQALTRKGLQNWSQTVTLLVQ